GCAGIMRVLLPGKSKLHGWVRRFGEGELREISRLVLLGLVILPLLPNRDMGYLGAINPFKIWLLVTLIVGISLAACLASKFIGSGKGAVISGVLGGMISSTATTAGMARRSRLAPETAATCALITMIASATVFVRVMAEILLAAGTSGRPMLAPFAILFGWSLVVSWLMARFVKIRQVDMTGEEVPSEFKAAVVFALLYVLVLLGVACAKEHLGDTGLYMVAAVSGLTDMDAITLSTSDLVAMGHLDTGRGWRLILLGGLANMAFKAGMAALLAHPSMLRPLLAAFGATAAGAVALWIWWP
ncbi:MAG: MgtC/SapB family protein, partial [Luteolibacter sp.]